MFEQLIEKLVEVYCNIRKELELFNDKLIHKPEIIALNKIDLFSSNPEILLKAQKALRNRIHSIRGAHPEEKEPYLISAVSGKGNQELLLAAQKMIRSFGVKDKSKQRVLLPSECIKKTNESD